MNDGVTLVIGAVVFFLLGALSMRLYWTRFDPWLRRSLGRLLGVEIFLGEQRIWQINDESIDSLNPRNMIVRPAQMLSLMIAAMLPLLVTIVILAAIFRG